MNRDWKIRWEYHLCGLTMRGLARKHQLTVAQVEEIIRRTARDWKKLRRR